MQLETLSSFEDQHHEQFMEQGYLRLGKLLAPDELAAIQQRIDAIMLGKVRYENMRFQLDPRYTGSAMTRTVGNQEATLNYRRIDDLEQDPLFLAYMQKPLIRQITRRYIGEDVAVFRSMFMNKPAERGTELVWHQDIGVGWKIDTNPIITVWTTFDAATVHSGCMQIVPGSNNLGNSQRKALHVGGGSGEIYSRRRCNGPRSGGGRSYSATQLFAASFGHQHDHVTPSSVQCDLHGCGDSLGGYGRYVSDSFRGGRTFARYGNG